MLASTSTEFLSFYNKIDIIPEKNKAQLEFCVAAFLKEAILAYFAKNKKMPSGVIIYRQGVSRQQKAYLKDEVFQINSFLTGTDDEKYLAENPIPYYYVLVNTKTNYKFFEQSKQRNVTNYDNPSPGLLVIDEITDPDLFEFYIQPQQVTGGTATPTSYHVAFGNMNEPSFIPKFTYDLCYLYPNWQGAVRVPGVLKNAEKLSKMTAKYTKTEIHQNLKNSLAYL
jgi:hypothetical protein